MTTQKPESNAGLNDQVYDTRVTEYSNNFKVNSTISASALKDRDPSNLAFHSLRRVNQLGSPLIMTIDEIKNENNYKNSFNYLDRGKYKRSVSQQRNFNNNENLSKIVKENYQKEYEIESNEKTKHKMQQIKQHGELKHQVKYSNDMRKMLVQSNMSMDENYINMYYLTMHFGHWIYHIRLCVFPCEFRRILVFEILKKIYVENYAFELTVN